MFTSYLNQINKNKLIRLLFFLTLLMSAVLFFFINKQVSASEMSSTEILEASPIEKAYAGAEFVLFLHEDTSVSGLGSNVGDILGREGGSGNNTGELVRVSGPTGFEKLKVKRGYAFGFKPIHESDGLYDVYNFDKNMSINRSGVRDYDHTGRGRYDENPHDGFGYITEDGLLRQRGSDYSINLGIGRYFVGERSVGGSGRVVLSPDDNSNKVVLSNFATKDRSSSRRVYTSDVFSPSVDGSATIELSYDKSSSLDYPDTTFRVEVLDSKDKVIFSKSNPYRVHNSAWTNIRHLELENLKADEEYRLRFSVSNTGFTAKVRERTYLKNVTDIHWSTKGSSFRAGDFTAVVGGKDIYVHRQGWGYVRKLNVPSGVDLNAGSIKPGVGSGYFVLDEEGKLYKYRSNTDLKAVSFPEVNGKDFFDTYRIVEVENGEGFSLAIAERIVDGVTHVYSWGKNDRGKLGLEGVSIGENVSVPTLVTRNGEPLENIQTIAAGIHFSIIVQNTDEGQLVWSSGNNNKGQLGGGLILNQREPHIVPGLENIDDMFVHLSPSVMVRRGDEYLTFGGVKSYPEEVRLPSHINGFNRWTHVIGRYKKEDIMSKASGPTVILSDDKKVYTYGSSNYDQGLASGGNWDEVIISSRFVGDKSVGRENNSRNFDSVIDATISSRAGYVIDKNNRIWGWGQPSRNGVRIFNTHYRGEDDAGTQYAHPMVMSNGKFAPNIFQYATGGRFALTKDGKLWRIDGSINPISSTWQVNNVKLEFIATNVPGTRNIGIDSNGEVWRWTLSGAPVKINRSSFNGKNIIHAAEGHDFTLFVDEDGAVWSMGNNDYGKLGDGTLENRNMPIKAKNIENVVKVFAGENMSFAIDEDGRLWSWGYAAYGSLGNNFALERNRLSTAAGNDLPIMTIENEIRNIYISVNGKDYFTFFGTIREKEQEETTIAIDVMGNEKMYKVDSESWELDIYDEVIEQMWELSWRAEEFDDGDAQFLTIIEAEDERGGVTQQFFSGNIIVDNEAPHIPTWGETCILDRNGNEQSCHSGQHFKHQGGNPVNTPIRLYANVKQKDGMNKAPTHVQYQYRKFHPHGYINDWSEWITMENKNDNGFYEDFFEGFLDEHQIRIRAIDEAENVSSRQEETRYTLISDAGAEVERISIVPGIDENKLYNEISIKGMTPDNSKIMSYSIQRHKKGERDSDGKAVWVDLTDGRQTWEESGNEMVFFDEDDSLVGNTEYIYKVDLENSITIGKSKEASVITDPYEPINFTRVPTDEGIDVAIAQSERNEGDILYRLVLIESRTGLTEQFDYTSTRREEDVIYRVKKSDVRKYELKNNKLDILLVYKGANGNYHTIIYDKEFNLNESILNDVIPPSVTFDLGTFRRLNENDSMKIELTLFASDDNTAPSDLQVQFSKDGSNWFGYREGGRWSENHWGNYQTTYKNFDVSDLSGRHMIYARVRDEAGNIGYDSEEILIAQNVFRDNDEYAADRNPNQEAIDDDNRIHVNSNNIELRIPRSGDLTEVQYSFDGVQWFDWEPVPSNGIKHIELTQGEGQKAVYTRYRNKHDSVTPVKEEDIIRYVLDFSPPSLSFKTGNGTLITKLDGVALFITPLDNFSNVMTVELESDHLTMHEFSEGEPQITGPLKISRETTYPIIIKGLRLDFNEINFRVKDRAGNESKESIRVYRKE